MQEQQLTTAEIQEDQASEYLLPLWRLVDELPYYPVPTEVAVALCRAGGWDASPAVVNEFVRKGYFPEPARHPVSGEVGWSAAHICLFAQALEARRRWVPGHQVHMHKLWNIELKEAISSEQGGCAIPDLHQYSVEDLVLMLAGEMAVGVRQVIVLALRLKLAEEFQPLPEDLE